MVRGPSGVLEKAEGGRNTVEIEPVEMRTFEEQVGVGEGMEVRLQ